MSDETDDLDQPEAELVVALRLGNDHLGTPADRRAIERLGDQFDEALAAAEAGEYQGEETGAGECLLFFETCDRQRTMAIVAPLIAASPLAARAELVVPATRSTAERRVSI